ncbi:hypothetical protein GCM10009730_65250 [Streptomyces albidochromogenes]
MDRRFGAGAPYFDPGSRPYVVVSGELAEGARVTVHVPDEYGRPRRAAGRRSEAVPAGDGGIRGNGHSALPGDAHRPNRGVEAHVAYQDALGE